MIIKSIKYILMILCVCVTALLAQTNASYAENNCDGAYQPQTQDDGTTPNTANLFDDKILDGMHIFMVELYKTLSKPLMIGHSLICYADKVAYHCIGIKGLICIVRLLNFNLFISGMIIYIVGVLMIMSIGMYFVDISFKLGFAMLFMPISIALWPFPATKNKFGENLSIVIRNGMLFALISIGTAVAINLIKSCLFPKNGFIHDESSFWTAISNKSTDALVSNFAFDEFHFLVMGFGLIFALKILASSINDYLDYFFSDSVFGSESPMHHMGTQAVGLVKANVVDRAASFVKDVAKNQTGRAIAGLGGGIAKLGSAKGRGELAQSIRNKTGTVKRVVTNPRTTINSAVTSIEETAKNAIGSGVKGVVNSALLLTPGKDSWRQKLEKNADEWIDDNITHGKLRNLAADTIAFGANTYNQAIGKEDAKFVTRDDVKNAVNESLESVKDDLKNLKKQGLKETTKQGIVKTATMAHNLKEMANGTPENMMDEDDMREKLHDIKEDVNDKYVKPVTSAAETYAQPLTDKLDEVAYQAHEFIHDSVDEFKQDVQDLKSGAKEKLDKLSATKLAQATKKAWKESDKAPVTLQLSALISAPFKGTKGAVKGTYKHLTSKESWVNDMEKLATGWESFQKAKEDKVILKKTGQIVLRTAARSIKGTGQDIKKAAEGTASIFGNMLKDFGKSMQDNSSHSNTGFTSWEKIHEREEAKKAHSREEKEYYSSLSDKYDNDK